MKVYDEIDKLYSYSEIYNNEFGNYEDDYSFWEFWFKKLRPKSVLEIGIGNGRLINLLSNLVDTYDAVEISKNIIEDFYKKNPGYNKGIIYNQDMKKMNIDNKYDLIILPFNTFCYLYTTKDFKSFFKSLKKLINKNSIVVIDIINPKIEELSDIENYRLCNKFKIRNENYELYEKRIYDNKLQIMNYEKRYVNEKNKDELLLNLPVRIFFPQELKNLIEFYNFKIQNIYGDYNNELFTNLSRKQILFFKECEENEVI